MKFSTEFAGTTVTPDYRIGNTIKAQRVHSVSKPVEMPTPTSQLSLSSKSGWSHQAFAKAASAGRTRRYSRHRIAGNLTAGNGVTRCLAVLGATLMLSALTAPGVAVAQNDDTQPAQPELGSDATVTLNFQDADIRALINTVSQVTGRNFVVDPRVKGKVTLVSGQKLSRDQIYEVFLSVLEVHNFAAVPAGDVTKILPANIVKQRPTRMVFDEGAPAIDEQITQVYQLQHSSVQELIPILRPLLPPTSHFAAHATTNTLVFTDTGANINRIIEIIRHIDQPDRRSDVHVVFLQHAKSSEMARILSQLVGSLQPAGIPGEQQNPALAARSKKNVSVQADDSLNALIIQSPDTEFQLLQAVVDQLDVPREAGGDIHVIYLKFAKAADLVTILSSVVAEGTAGGGTSGGDDGGGAPRAAGPIGESKVTIEADEDNNALVIRADSNQFAEIESVVEKLDRRRSQVFVETIIAEVSTNRAADLGVSWQGQERVGSPFGTRTLTGGTSFSAVSGGLQLGFLDNLIRVPRITDGVAVTDSGNIVTDLIPNMSVVLQALRADTNTNILSTPNLLTLDNESAEIVVGQEVPFITGQFTTNQSTTSNSTDSDGNTQTGINNPFQTIERKEVGLTLKITPQVNDGDAIRLEIEQEISNVSRAAVSGASDLITDKRKIQATVQVDDGQIVVLGGLIRDDLVDGVEWVPVLGEIPLLGALFRRKSKQATKTNLMVFLRPKVIRTPADLSKFTRDRYFYIQDKSLDSQPKTRRMLPGTKAPRLPDIDEWRINTNGRNNSPLAGERLQSNVGKKRRSRVSLFRRNGDSDSGQSNSAGSVTSESNDRK